MFRTTLSTFGATLFLSGALTSAFAAADPSLQLHLDFESLEKEPGHARYWFRDQSPNGFDVFFYTSVLTLVPSKNGQAVQGRGPGVVITDGAPIYAEGEGLTISVWARMSGNEGTLHPIIIMDNTIAGFAQLNILSTPDHLSFGWIARQPDGVQWAWLSGSKTIPPTTEWNHFAAVYHPDEATAYAYINGDEVLRSDVDGSLIGDWGKPPRWIKIRLDTNDDHPIAIDELRLYTRVLNPDEIRDVMRNEGTTDVSPAGKLTATWGAFKVR
ncbi:MAG: LamG domain-containing protein [Candidatus Poribacteria bacterium]|nr:LamG domain-containing protein [Candidatus Poribacteria bacterium]